MEQNNINLPAGTNDIANDKVSNTPYDDVHKTLTHDCPSLLIPLINEVFNESYKGDEKIIFLHNEHFINIQGETTKEKNTDSYFEIQGQRKKKYHVESQSTTDSSMLLRLFEYDSQAALDDAVVKEHSLVVDFPRSAVLFLRHTKDTPDKMNIIIRTPGGNVSYCIPVVKTQEYTLQTIFEKNLLFLLPFYIFRYEKKFKYYENNLEKLQELKSEYLYIRERLDRLSRAEKITEYEKRTIMEMCQRVVDGLAKNYSQVREGVDAIMGGNVLEYEAKRILQRGIHIGEREGKIIGEREGRLIGEREGKIIGEREGEIKGKVKGRIDMCLELVNEGILSLSDAAKRLNMKEEELKTYLQ